MPELTPRRPLAQRLRALLTLLILAATALLAGPAPAAVAAGNEADAYYIGADGGLWSYHYSATANSWTTATRIGPASLAPPGARVAAIRLPGHRPAVYFTATDGSVLQYCGDHPTTDPYPLSGPGSAQPGGRISVAWASSQLTLATAGWAGLAAAPTATASLFTDPCLQYAVDWRQLPPSAGYPTATESATYAIAGRAGILTVGDSGAVTVSWTSQASGNMTTYTIAPAGSARPNAGIAVAPGTSSSTFSVFYAGRDGRLNQATISAGAGRSGALQPNTTAPAGTVPDGAVLSAAKNASGTAVGYVATDGAVTLAHLSTAGLWQSTEAVSAAGFSTPGGSVAISDVDGYPACGTNGPVPVHFGPVRGPSPDPWVTAGPNVSLGALMTFA
ncbi:hypothetical protein ACFV4P_03665 [Kitasatospora sp. NPDC059795]|uniref:hypothetical protein n=1 Tax=Kitasatospora sp. NPDC059795 TaxID=3346949 RepID=UPI003649E729